MGLLGEWRNEQDEEPQPWMTKSERDEWLQKKPEGLRSLYEFLGPAPDQWYGSMLPLKYGPQDGGINRLRTAMPQSIRSPLIGMLDVAAATKTGQLTPEALDFITMLPLGVGALLAPRGAIASGGSRRTPTKGEPPRIRDRATNEAISIAREEPHLIKSRSLTEGYYVGGPPNVRNYEDLQALRRRLDKDIEAGAKGADWYERTRASFNEVTGGDPVANKYMSHQHAMFSGRVPPGHELGFAQKENNASIAGQPQRAARQWQHEAHLDAVDSKDARRYLLGNKTEEYQKHIEPPPPNSNYDPRDTATGVTDFRVAKRYGYTDLYNITPAQHAFIDYENALALDRARQGKFAGRSDWTGEEVQAAIWVNDKKESILKQRPSILGNRLKAVEKRAAAEGLSPAEKSVLIEQAKAEADAEAFSIANQTIRDHLDKHTAYDTYPTLPGDVLGHMSGLTAAGADVRAAYASDRRSTWATAPGGRDAIYAGAGIPETGVSMRVRPTTAIPEEFTEVARPLVALQTKGRDKVMPAPDRMLLDHLSFMRGAVDALPEVRVIKTWDGGNVAQSNAVRFDFHRPLTRSERLQLSEHMKANGLPEVVDTGRGVVAANFEGGPIDIDRLRAVQRNIQEVLPDANPMRTYAEQVHHDLRPLFAKGEGSGAITDELLRKLDSSPAVRDTVDQNVYLPKVARARAERDEEWAMKLDSSPRQDIQNFRHLIGEGPGGIARLREARQTNSISLPSHVPVPFAPTVRAGSSVSGEAGVPSYFPMPVDDLPKMTEASMARQARELIEQSISKRLERQREQWLRRNAPPASNYLIRRDQIA